MRTFREYREESLKAAENCKGVEKSNTEVEGKCLQEVRGKIKRVDGQITVYDRFQLSAHSIRMTVQDNILKPPNHVYNHV